MTLTTPEAVRAGITACAAAQDDLATIRTHYERQRAHEQTHRRIIADELTEMQRGLGIVKALLPLVAQEEAAARRRRAKSSTTGPGRGIDTAGLDVVLIRGADGTLVHAVRLLDLPSGHLIKSLLGPDDCPRDGHGAPLAVLAAVDRADLCAPPPARIGPVAVVQRSWSRPTRTPRRAPCRASRSLPTWGSSMKSW